MKWLLFACSFILAAFSTTKLIKTWGFTMETPDSWHYVKQKGVDSFTGEIKGPKIKLEFDHSDQGYASLHVVSPQAYVKLKIDREFSKAFNDHKYTYEEPDKISFLKDHMTEEKWSLLRPTIHPSTKIQSATPEIKEKTKVDYVVYLTHNDSTILKQVTLPEEINQHHFSIDTTASYIVTTIWPKKPGNGYTGVLIESLHSNFSFSMEGKDLPPKQERFALNAFKTIQIKEGH